MGKRLLDDEGIDAIAVGGDSELLAIAVEVGHKEGMMAGEGESGKEFAFVVEEEDFAAFLADGADEAFGIIG